MFGEFRNEFATERGERRPCETGTPEINALRGCRFCSVDVVTHDGFLLCGFLSQKCD
jgi:hypothetical protein